MTDHAGHTRGMPMPPDRAKESTSAKSDAATPSRPATADPHAGHDTGAAVKPADSPQGADNN